MHIHTYICTCIYTTETCSCFYKNVVVFDGTVKDLLLNVPQHKRMYATKIRLCGVVTTLMFRHS